MFEKSDSSSNNRDKPNANATARLHGELEGRKGGSRGQGEVVSGRRRQKADDGVTFGGTRSQPQAPGPHGSTQTLRH